ncbi:MAG: hypothetical protein ACRDHE_11775, partial [Ktedonobacterales bacterium]
MATAVTASMPHNLTTGVSVTIVRIQLVTSTQVVALLDGESTGVPDDTLLYYVDLRGTFTFAGPAGVSATYQHGYEVFDAHSG